jgi:hypothetical protein
MVDLSWIRNRISEPCKISVISHKKEIREILVEIGGDTAAETVFVDIDDTTTEWNGSELSFEQTAGTRFYEAQAGLIKTGMGSKMAEMVGLEKANEQHTYYTGTALIPKCYMRSFVLKQVITGSLKEVARWLKDNGIDQANVSAREFSMTAEAIRKELKLKDGGDLYLFFSGSGKNKKCWVGIPD